MKARFVADDECHDVTGVAVVVDVLSVFSSWSRGSELRRRGCRAVASAGGGVLREGAHPLHDWYSCFRCELA